MKTNGEALGVFSLWSVSNSISLELYCRNVRWFYNNHRPRLRLAAGGWIVGCNKDKKQNVCSRSNDCFELSALCPEGVDIIAGVFFEMIKQIKLY